MQKLKKKRTIKMPEVKYRRLRRYRERLLKMKPLIRQLNRYIDRVV
jgi:hypothetical protein